MICKGVIRKVVLSAGLLLGVSAGVQSAAATDSAVLRACAHRDLAAWTAIERHGDEGTVPSAALADAAFTLFRARGLCLEGHDEDAFLLYDRIGGLGHAVAGAEAPK